MASPVTRIATSKPIAPLGVRLLLLVLLAILSFAVYHGTRPDANGRWELGIRIFIPVFALIVYLLIAVIVNRRRVRVDADGVRTYFDPLPGFASESIPREQVRLCFLRNVQGFADGQQVENYWATGVETAQGRQILVRYPFETSELALIDARNLADVLNQHPQHSRVEVRTPSATVPSDLSPAKIIFFWFVLFMAAIAVGGAWEIMTVL